MGTRSITKVFSTHKNENKQVKIQLVNMYRQYDGYPSGMGADLSEFLNSGKVVNGISCNEQQRVFNGVGCLAAQMIAHFKEGAGGIYIQPISAKNCGQEYEYEIIVDYDTHEITFKCIEVGYIDAKGKYKTGKRILFEGKPTEFAQFLEKNKEIA